MGTKRLLTLLALVTILGGVSMYYTNLMKTPSAEEMMDTPAMEVSSSEAAMTDVSAAEADTVVPARSSGSAVTPTAAAPAIAANTIEADMNALDALADVEYDDAALEAAVTGTTANSLTESYDF